MGGTIPPPDKGAAADGGKKSGGGLWGWLGRALDNVSVDFNVGSPAPAPRAPAGNPTDPAARMEPVRQDRKETYDEMVYRTTDGTEGQAPAVRVGRERQHVARSLDGCAKPSNPDAAIPKGGGEPLAKDVRAKMEPKLGADLSDVRVHRSGPSAEAAHGLNAKAFTVGPDVHFGSGNYQPGTKEGDRLLAHELTHVVQGQRSGIQRKEADGPASGDGANHGHEDAAGGEDGAAGGHEVSQPEEPAEKEADAVADKVTDDLHAPGAEKKQKGKSKDGKGQYEEQGGAGGANHGDAAAPGDHASTAEVGGEKTAGAPKPIAAKLDASVGRKIQRSATLTEPVLAGGGRRIYRAPAQPKASAPASAVDPKKQAQIDKAKNCKSPAEVKEFCASDPIATQKLRDVDGETNIEGGKNDAARKDFYTKMANWIQTSGAQPTFTPTTIYNQCMNLHASDWKFKGETVKPANLGKALQRTQSVRGFYYNVVDFKKYEARFDGQPNQKKLAYDTWLNDAKTNPIAHMQKGELLPDGSSGTWFTPDSYKLTDAKDAGYAELLELAALQPEWFPEGNVVFQVDVSEAASKLVARRPTAYDGMQSALWVSRPGKDTFGVTGGGANEFLAGKVPRSAIKSANLVVPDPPLQQELQAAIDAARELALSQDPELKKNLDGAPDGSEAKKQLKEMVPNLTDLFLRGEATLTVSAHVRGLLQTVKTATERQRANPSATRAPGEIEAPSASSAKPAASASAGATSGAAGKAGPAAKAPADTKGKS